MTPIEPRELLTWIAIIAIIALAATTGMLINRFLIHRAHRRALAELRRRILEEPSPLSDSPYLINTDNSERY
ncbi:MAG: hypothetical protein HDR97_03480 [Bacteroides sp.]|nr:hypothetical protein [Bacteroides sp.]